MFDNDDHVAPRTYRRIQQKHPLIENGAAKGLNNAKMAKDKVPDTDTDKGTAPVFTDIYYFSVSIEIEAKVVEVI